MDAPPPTPGDRAATSEAIRLVEAAVDQLPLVHRATFMLRDVQDLSTAGDAGCRGVSEETVKIRLHRARNALRDALLAQVGPNAAEAFPFLAPRCNRIVAAVLARSASGSGKESL